MNLRRLTQLNFLGPINWRAVALLFVLFCGVWFTPAVQRRTDYMSVDCLIDNWGTQQSQITTAWIRCREVSQPVPLENGCTREELHALLSEMDFQHEPEDLITLSRILNLNLPVDDPWGSVQLVIGPNGRRQDIEYRGRTHSSHVVHSDGTTIIGQWANDQVNIFGPGQSRTGMASLQEFRHVPAAGNMSNAVIESRSDSEINLMVDHAHYVVDSNSGIVLRATLQADAASGREWLFRGISRYPGNVLFPDVSVYARYSGERLNFIRIRVIEEAVFNEDVDRDGKAYSLEATAGVKVFDRREDNTQPKFVRLENDVSDVRKAIDRSALDEF